MPGLRYVPVHGRIFENISPGLHSHELCEAGLYLQNLNFSLTRVFIVHVVAHMCQNNIEQKLEVSFVYLPSLDTIGLIVLMQ